MEAAIRNADEEIDEVREDIQGIQDDIQGIQNIFAFAGGTSGFSLLKRVANGSVVISNSLPSAGLYIFYALDTWGGTPFADTFSTVIVYYDGGNKKAYSGNFEFKHYIEGAGDYEEDEAYIYIATSGQVSLRKSSDGTTTDFPYHDIFYRKIG